MERKNQYIAPEMIMLKPVSDDLMYFTSVPGGEPDEGEPEAKEGLFEEESVSAYNLPGIEYDVWAEEEESTSYFKTK